MARCLRWEVDPVLMAGMFGSVIEAVHLSVSALVAPAMKLLQAIDAASMRRCGCGETDMVLDEHPGGLGCEEDRCCG